jgi:hypothetical protein
MNDDPTAFSSLKNRCEEVILELEDNTLLLQELDHVNDILEKIPNTDSLVQQL